MYKFTYRAVIIRSIASRMSKVAPVCASEDLKALLAPPLDIFRATVSYHIQVENCHSGRVVVLVKDTLVFLINEGSAFLESRSAPGIKRATLKLNSLSANCKLLVVGVL